MSIHASYSASGIHGDVPADRDLRVLEFFAGIGGMRLALPPHVLARVKTITAFEISLVAAEAYRLNFPEGASLQADVAQHAASSSTADHSPADHGGIGGRLRVKLIEQLSLRDVEDQSDIWVMSPPCQPFTRTLHSRQQVCAVSCADSACTRAVCSL